MVQWFLSKLDDPSFPAAARDATFFFSERRHLYAYMSTHMLNRVGMECVCTHPARMVNRVARRVGATDCHFYSYSLCLGAEASRAAL